MPHLASLAVGFNYGSWQLWSTATLLPDFSSKYEGKEALPLVDFTFQVSV